MVRLARNLTRKTLALLTSLVLVLFWVPGLVSAPPAFASDGTVTDSTPGNFEIDGNLVQNDTSTPLDDWGNVLTGPTGADAIGTADTSVFQTSSKEDDAASTWTAGTSHVDPKNDIGGLYAYSKPILTPAPAKEFFYFGWDRVANNGTDFYKVELNQSKLLDQTSDKTLDIPHRTQGDKRISLHDQGGSTIFLDEIDHWDATASDWVCDQGPSDTKLTATGGSCTSTITPGTNPTGFFYNVNAVDISMPSGWTSTSPVADTQSGVLHAEQFVELGFNMTQLGLVPDCPSPGFGHAMLRNVTGQSNGNLKDYVEPIQIDVQSTCAALHIRKYDSGSTALNGATFQISPNPATGTAGSSVLVTDGDTNTPPVAGHIADPDGAPNGQIDIDTAKPNTIYTVTETAAPSGYLLPSPASLSTTSTAVCTTDPANCDGTGKVLSLGSATFNFHDPLGSVTFYKVDGDNGNAALGGATFLVHRTSGGGSQSDVTVVDDGTNDALGAGADATPGTIKVTGLKTGDYEITETAAPSSWYTVDSTKRTFSISDATPNPDLNGTNDAFVDLHKLSKLVVEKIAGDGAASPGAALSGADFELYEVATPSDVLVGSCTTGDGSVPGQDGQCAVGGLDWGHSYYWKEITAPAGYNLPDDQTLPNTPITIPGPGGSATSLPTSFPVTTFSDKVTAISTVATDGVAGTTAVHDTANLTNVRTDAAGTITFKAYLNDNTCSDSSALKFTSTVDVLRSPASGGLYGSGDFAATLAGTYYWKVDYSGDTNDVAASAPCGDDQNGNREYSVVEPHQPQISTTASDTNTVTGVLGDSATVSDYVGTPTGTVTFTLYDSCATAALGSVTVPIGTDGTASTAGHPATTGSFAATNTGDGLYYWAASYSGDDNNKPVSEACDETNTSETSHAPVLDGPHKYNNPGNAPDATVTDTTVSIYANDNQITYTVTVHNSGAAAMNNLTVTDTVSALSTYNSGSISCSGDATTCTPDASGAPDLSWAISGLPGKSNALPDGGTETLHFSVTVNPSDARGSDIQNQATATNGGVSKQTEIVDNPVAYPDLSINKCASPAPQSIPVGTNADCTVDASGLVAPNSSITYALTVTNTGNADATGVTVTDAVPVGTTYVSATCDSPCSASESGGTVTWSNVSVPKKVGSTAGTAVVHFTVNVNSGLANGTHIDNVGSFTWSNSGSTTTNDQHGTSATVRHVVGFPVIGENKFADPLPREDGASGIVHLGQTITYTVQASNTGLAPSTVTITDAIPTGTTYTPGSAQCDSGAPADCAPSGPASGVLTWTMTLPGSSTATVSFQVTVNSDDHNGQILSNHAVVNGNNTRTVTHEVTFPIITAIKSSNPVSGTQALPTLVGPNTNIAYTVTVSNAGLQGATGVTVTDQVPAGTTYNNDASCNGASNCTVQANTVAGVTTITWTLDMPAGTGTEGHITAATQDLTFSITTPTVQSKLIDNTASFTNNHTPGCATTTCDTNTTHHKVVFPVINAHKTSSPASGTVASPTPVTPDQVITYSIAVDNSGQADATGVAVSDVVPTGTTYVAGSADATGGTYDSGTNTVHWTLNVAQGQTVTVTFQAKVPSNATNGTLIDNTATFSNVHTPNCLAAGSGLCSTETTHHVVKFPIIGAVKSSDPVSGTVANPTPVTPNQVITYTIAVTNSGLADAHAVPVTDVIPSGTTYVAGSADHGGVLTSGTLSWSVDVPAQSTVNLQFQVKVDAGDTNGTLIDNTATVNGTPTNTTHHVVKFPIIGAVKSSDPVSGTVADPTPVSPGQVITYTIAVSNTGLADAHGVTVTDAIPSGTTYVAASADHGGTLNGGTLSWTIDVAAQSSVSLHFQVTVDAGDANGTLIDNTAVVNGTSTNTTHHEVKFPIVGAVKSSDPVSGTVANPTPVKPGQTISYTIVVSNTGLAAANAVPVTDAIPAGTTYVAGSADNGGTLSGGSLSWTIDVAAQSSVSLHFQVTVDGSDANGTLIDNTAKVNHTDTNTTHHEVEFSILSMAKTSNPVSGSIVQRGDKIDYTITITNAGLAAAPQQVVTDTLPDHVTVVAGSASPAFTTSSGSTVTWTVDVPAGTLSGGTVVPSTTTLTYSVTVDKDAPEGATLTNVALINGQCVGSADESACTTDHHVPTGALTLVKHVNKSTANYGDTLTYTFDASTIGGLNQTNVTVTDVLPKDTTYVNNSAGCTDAGTCTASFSSSTRTVTWQLGAMAAGTTRHLVFKVSINTPTFDPSVGLPPKTILNSGVISSTETASTPSNVVKTTVVAVLGVKVIKKKTLPFTGLPAQTMVTVALLMLGAGITLTTVRRRRES